MKYVTKFFAVSVLVCFSSTDVAADGMREEVVRHAALRAGLVAPAELEVLTDPEIVRLGGELFQSRLLSLAEDTACASCHIDRFGSADGIPVAIGTDASGFGEERIRGGGDIIPRNALALWGRGGIGFEVFFYDGRVELVSGDVLSQFGGSPPSDDPLTVAAHLPPVEIGEMLGGDVERFQTETVDSADAVYSVISERVRQDARIGPGLARALVKPLQDLEYSDIAFALASFIRFNFAITETAFHRFVFDREELSDQELRGALLFYGRAGCASCHNGPYFSDFDFHVIPFPQLGFGRNGFGIDYGRFNVTLDTNDLYSFRTPPLYNVTRTGPYSHSGSVEALGDAILYHVDPLLFFNAQQMGQIERVDFYQRMQHWSRTPLNGVVLSEGDLEDIVEFLGTLEFSGRIPVQEVD